MPTDNPLYTQQAPSLLKLGACLIYEGLVVIALSFACALVFIIVIGDASYGVKRVLLQLFLWVVIGVYFVWCWHKSGQTLAMQTWRLKVQNSNAQLLSVQWAMVRYVLATVSLLLFGLGFLWAMIDDDHLFLHDRLLKNKFIATSSNNPMM